ncbi:MAG: protein-L-isoaspartate(D-aspartate) O-methyltransferase [Nitrosopumilus sp.]|nr:protein-L-isoaspartate(D-aspartate) O-methyltransferase [Nitrosopumilus sp.]
MNKIQTDDNYQSKIDKLIKIMKISGFLNDNKVELAIRNSPRHEFVPKSFLDIAYENMPIPLMKNQTISQPAVVSRMTEWLNVFEGQKILEVGSGSGWQSAILSFLVGHGKIFSIDRHSKLVKFAKENLNKLEIHNVDVILGDGSLGLPTEAPFDRIIITAACKKVPPPLFEQLSTDGLLIAPVGEFVQSLILFKKTPQGIIEIKNQPGYAFVPLFGKFGISEN